MDGSVKIMTVRGLIFDCDGTVVDSEPYSCKAWNVLFEQEYGIEIGTDYSPVLGKNSIEAAQHYLETHDLAYDPEILNNLAAQKEEIYYQLAEGHLKPVHGCKQFIHAAKLKGYQVAVASSGVEKKINFNLQQVGLLKAFKVIVNTTEVEKGKPAPDLFLKAAERMEIPIKECVVFEDSIAGVQAGIASGAYTVALTTTFPAADLGEADRIIPDFTALKPDQISKVR